MESQKIQLMIFDEWRAENSDGVHTYLNQLTPAINHYRQISVSIIWINSKVSDIIKETKSNITHYYFPKKRISNGDSNFEIELIEYLSLHISSKKNILIQFNWINHCRFAHLLKLKFRCVIVLIKHWSPWRNYITSNYPLFKKLNERFTNKVSDLVFPTFNLSDEQIHYHAVDHIICVSESGRQSLEKVLCYPSQKISVIYNGLNLVINRSRRSNLRRRYGIGIDEKVIIFVGSVIDRKGIYDLVKAFDAVLKEYPIDKIRLIIAGTGNHNLLMENVKKGWARITITGKLSKKNLYDFYTMADIGVVPSYVEPFGYTALEMMLAGLPLIVANVDGLKEIVPDECGLKLKVKLGKSFAKIDTVDLKKKLLFFLTNEDAANSFAQKARRFAFKNFSAETMAAKTISLYERLLTRANEENLKKSYRLEKSSPIVTIIVYVYNAEIFITDCLNSILNQKRQDFEIIIIDDNSTDNSSSIIRSFNDSRIKYTKNNRKKGFSYCVYNGVLMGSGKYTMWIRADCRLSESRLERQVQRLEADENMAAIGSWVFITNQSGRVTSIAVHPVKDEEIKSLMLFTAPFSPESVMIRSSILQSIHNKTIYFERNIFSLWLAILKGFKVENVPECLTYVSSHPEDSDLKRLRNQQLLELHSSFLEENGIEPSVQELATHAAISLDHKLYFRTAVHADALQTWVNKVLEVMSSRYNYPLSLMEKFKKFIVFNLCDVNPNLLNKSSKQKVV